MEDFFAWMNQTPLAWVVLGIIIGVVVIWLYFLPTIVSKKRKHKNTLAIFILNLFSFFTGGIGWIIALVWACTDNTKKKGTEYAICSGKLKKNTMTRY